MVASTMGVVRGGFLGSNISTNSHMHALSTAEVKPHPAGAAYMSLARVVALVTSRSAVVGSP